MKKPNKKNQTYRIEAEQIEQLDKLVEHYEKEAAMFGLKLSKANVVELLIREKHEELEKQGKIVNNQK